MTDQTGTAPITQLHAAADRIITTSLAPSWLAGPLQAWLRDAAWDADTAVGPNRHAIAVANAILAQPEPAEHTAPTPAAEERRHPPVSRRDVSWTVIFRLEGTGIWTEWGKGHRTSSEAVREAEVLAHIPDVAEVRFERVTLQRDRFTLHDLAALDPQQNQPAAAPQPCPPGCIACATDESHDPTPADTSSTPRPAEVSEQRRTVDSDGACILDCPPVGDPSPCPCTPGVLDRRQRYAAAAKQAGDTAYGHRPFYDAITTAVMAVADAEQAALRNDVKRLGLMVDEYAAGARTLSDKLARVRAIHQPLTRAGTTCCAHCSGWDGHFRCRGVVTPWPCPTLAALDADRSQP